MSSNSINSPMAAQRNHSLSRRWTCGSGIRRRSGRGGKSAPSAAAHWALLALSHFQPHQETIAQHDGDGVAMKTIPAPALILSPAQLGFGFFMILLDPVAAVGDPRQLDLPGATIKFAGCRRPGGASVKWSWEGLHADRCAGQGVAEEADGRQEAGGGGGSSRDERA